MVIGIKEIFAIEISVHEIIDTWIFGSFIFWCNGIAIGNSEDKSVDLNGCINWLKDFITNHRNRFEENLYEKDVEEVFFLLCANVLSTVKSESKKEYYQNTYSRFHISHLGMSSFDSYIILLIENESKLLRCVWQKGQENIKEAFLPKGEMQKISAETIDWFEKERRNMEALAFTKSKK